MILGQDVVTYFQVIEQESPCHNEFPDQSTILAWMHCHVNGVKCHLSSIDLHKQFVLEQTFPHILAIVVEISPKGKQKHEFCRLSLKGFQKITACNQEECGPDQSVNKQSVAHKACSYPRFSEIVKKQIIFNNGTFRVIDSNNVEEFSFQENTTKSNAGQVKADNGENTVSFQELIECKGCKKTVRSIRLHLRSKECRQHYSDEEQSEFEKAKADQKKEYLKQYKQMNAKSIKKPLADYSAKAKADRKKEYLKQYR